MSWESHTAKVFNTYFERNQTDALAYRYPKASNYSVQPCDLLVDSLDRRYYLAVECKSFKYTKQKQIYFSSTFSKTKAGESQIEHLFEFCNKTGRSGWLAVLLRGKPQEAYLVPFGIVYDLYSDLRPGIPIDVVKQGVPLRREKIEDKLTWVLDTF